MTHAHTGICSYTHTLTSCTLCTDTLGYPLILQMTPTLMYLLFLLLTLPAGLHITTWSAAQICACILLCIQVRIRTLNTQPLDHTHKTSVLLTYISLYSLTGTPCSSILKWILALTPPTPATLKSPIFTNHN